MAKTFKRMNGEKMPEFIVRCREEQAAAGRIWPPKPKRKRKSRAKPKIAPVYADEMSDNLGLFNAFLYVFY